MSARQIHAHVFGRQALPLRVGRYAIVRVLGEGAMGVVYQGHDASIDRPVAVKTIRRALLSPQASDLAPLARFRNEAQAAGRLNHPNIVSVYEYGEDRGELYIAMEYVLGASLVECTSRSVRLPLADALCLMVQLLDALHHAHEQGVWHRDIKPANLIVTPDGRLKVTDFGIARIDSGDLARDITVMSAVMGSPGYMAPERYTDAAPDRRVDIFAAGVLLYELLTGAAPFMGSQDAVMVQVLHREPPAPSTLPMRDAPPAALDPVIARALAKQPGDRYATALEMREALVQAAGTLTIASRVSPTSCARLMNLAGVAMPPVLPTAAARPPMPSPQPSAAQEPIAAVTPDRADGPVTADAPIDTAACSAPAPIPALMQAVYDCSGTSPFEAPVASTGAARPSSPSSGPRTSAEPVWADAPAAARDTATAPGPQREPVWQATQWIGRPPTASDPAMTPQPTAPAPQRPPVQPGAFQLGAFQPGASAADAAPVPPARAVSGSPARPVAAPPDPAFLSQLTGLLRPALGAMAEITVRHTARRHATPVALVLALADEAVTPDERSAFLKAARALVPAEGSPAPAATVREASRPAPPPGPLPVLGSTPMRPGDEQAAQHALARLVGPIATLFVRRAASRARTREEFFSSLADLSEGTVERRQVLAALWKSA